MQLKIRRGLTPYAHARGADAYGMANAVTINTTKSEKAETFTSGSDCYATFLTSDICDFTISSCVLCF
jgi:hypothetical protein